MSFWDKLKSLFSSGNTDSVSDADEESVTVESLAEEQKVIDDLYAREGLTDRVLDMQVALNQKRNKYDISDKNNLNDDGWSQ